MNTNKNVYQVTVYENYGRQEWRNEKGQYHRVDGPAIIDGDYQEWWVEGKLHRVDGPAIIDGDRQEWCKEGKRHRLDGPAIIDGDVQEWWIDGVQYTKEQFDEKIRQMKQSPSCEGKIVEIDGKKYRLSEIK